MYFDHLEKFDVMDMYKSIVDRLCLFNNTDDQNTQIIRCMINQVVETYEEVKTYYSLKQGEYDGMNAKKILYSILKEIKDENKINYDTYDITKEEFAVVIEHALDKNYIKNAFVSRGGQGNKAIVISISDGRITFDGEVYLDENNSLSKTYKGLKEIREWLPL